MTNTNSAGVWRKLESKPILKEAVYKWKIPAGGYGVGNLAKWQAKDFYEDGTEMWVLDETPQPDSKELVEALEQSLKVLEDLKEDMRYVTWGEDETHYEDQNYWGIHCDAIKQAKQALLNYREQKVK